MATDTGWCATAFLSAFSSLAGTSSYPSMVTIGDVDFLQLACRALYGYASSPATPPCLAMYWNAPPLHPALAFVSQSTSCCSDSEVRFLVLMALTPSTAAIVENAQHEPHWPWSLTSVTAPFWRQSTDAGRSRGGGGWPAVAAERAVVGDPGAGVVAAELVGGHVGEAVEAELVRLVALVELVDEPRVLLEHVEAAGLLGEVARHRVHAAPALVEIPQGVLRGKVIGAKVERGGWRRSGEDDEGRRHKEHGDGRQRRSRHR
nr:unnamed protein product [Digitaria exilis]CAB3483790.1 unnamed protein product [Digitaria exilis]